MGTAKKEEFLKVLGETRKPVSLRFGGDYELGFNLNPVVIQDLGMAVNLAGPTLKEWNIDQLHSRDALRVKGRFVRLHREQGLQTHTELAAIPLRLNKTTLVPAQRICHLDVTCTQISAPEDVFICGNQTLIGTHGITPWVAGLTTTTEQATVRVGLCSNSDEDVWVREGTRYGDLVRSRALEEEDRMPWRVATVDKTPAAAPVKKLTVRQKLDDIIEKLKRADTGPVEEKKRPVTKDKKEECIREEFKIATNKMLRNTPTLETALVRLLLKDWNVISVVGEYGETELLEHPIATADAAPIKCRNQPLNPALEQQLEKQLKDWLDRGVIEPSSSPWSFPLVAAPKKNGKIRWCVDYRKLNAVTIKDTYPLPLIEDNLAKLAESKIFSCLDGAGAFHVIPIREEDKQKTAFATPFGLYHFQEDAVRTHEWTGVVLQAHSVGTSQIAHHNGNTISGRCYSPLSGRVDTLEGNRGCTGSTPPGRSEVAAGQMRSFQGRGRLLGPRGICPGYQTSPRLRQAGQGVAAANY